MSFLSAIPGIAAEILGGGGIGSAIGGLLGGDNGITDIISSGVRGYKNFIGGVLGDISEDKIGSFGDFGRSLARNASNALLDRHVEPTITMSHRDKYMPSQAVGRGKDLVTIKTNKVIGGTPDNTVELVDRSTYNKIKGYNNEIKRIHLPTMQPHNEPSTLHQNQYKYVTPRTNFGRVNKRNGESSSQQVRIVSQPAVTGSSSVTYNEVPVSRSRERKVRRKTKSKKHEKRKLESRSDRNRK